MPFIDALPVWVIGILIFLLRIVDVSIGTLRTILMVQGYARFAVFLGFFEVLVWVVAVAQVVARIDASPWLAPFYAGGFSAGVAVGLMIERKLALGRFVIRIFSHSRTQEIVHAIRGKGNVLATFRGDTPDGPVNLLFVSARGERVHDVVDAARAVDPKMFYTVEAARRWSENVFPHPTGWRAVFKKK
jgi:uncharacterized protein YebE (UPF0316 family)